MNSSLTLIGMKGNTFISLSVLDQILFAVFYENFPTFFEVKININRVNLTPCHAHWVL